MLTRPGSQPGPAWMRKMSESAADPQQYRRFMKRFWIAYILFMFGAVAMGVFVDRQSLRHASYVSPVRVAGMPLLAIGKNARGFIAVGGQASGIFAIGAVAVGVFAFGGIAAGGIAVGGLSTGLLALGGLALGWRAIGGLAIGHAAFGGLAVGIYAYAGGGVALGRKEADGKQRETLVE